MDRITARLEGKLASLVDYHLGRTHASPSQLVRDALTVYLEMDEDALEKRVEAIEGKMQRLEEMAGI